MDLEIPIHEFEAIHNEEVELIDVREEWEYVAGHVPGAVNVPLSTLADNLDSIPKTRHYIICASGARSLRAAEALRNAGYESVSVSGGTMAWIERGNRVATEDSDQQSA
ncbi:MAG: rhodanese-like domain-containing protein [Ferrimicrobium sp.]|uniref:Rhodanese-like domain-containing protein n=1 Tax=Ferrimicrobium acidiphilum TaxID=121039 RepID=A0ABV3Y5C0_9ACTN|nr:rhodanese-like domain-containing protein [Ferrimicrobium sp.]